MDYITALGAQTHITYLFEEIFSYADRTNVSIIDNTEDPSQTQQYTVVIQSPRVGDNTVVAFLKSKFRTPDLSSAKLIVQRTLTGCKHYRYEASLTVEIVGQTYSAQIDECQSPLLFMKVAEAYAIINHNAFPEWLSRTSVGTFFSPENLSKT